MEIWYKINTWGTDIQEVKVQSDTDKFIVNEYGRRESKRTDSSAICKTKEECKAWRIAYHEIRVAGSQTMLEYEKDNLEQAKAIKTN